MIDKKRSLVSVNKEIREEVATRTALKVGKILKEELKKSVCHIWHFQFQSRKLTTTMATTTTTAPMKVVVNTNSYRNTRSDHF